MTFENSIIVENASGIGFEIFVPAGSPLYRYGEGEEIMVYTSMAVKEDDISLYGFHNREALELFELLTTVNGIGAKAAMAILSALSPEELRRAILFEDAKEISRANGSLDIEAHIIKTAYKRQCLYLILIGKRYNDCAVILKLDT